MNQMLHNVDFARDHLVTVFARMYNTRVDINIISMVRGKYNITNNNKQCHELDG
jgi:hypothetical protein